MYNVNTQDVCFAGRELSTILKHHHGIRDESCHLVVFMTATNITLVSVAIAWQKAVVRLLSCFLLVVRCFPFILSLLSKGHKFCDPCPLPSSGFTPQSGTHPDFNDDLDSQNNIYTNFERIFLDYFIIIIYSGLLLWWNYFIWQLSLEWRVRQDFDDEWTKCLPIKHKI